MGLEWPMELDLTPPYGGRGSSSPSLRLGASCNLTKHSFLGLDYGLLWARPSLHLRTRFVSPKNKRLFCQCPYYK
ncbi:hypothetical protein CRG98_003086 [Punica granatum]|uniref:Uncharacterized protein n=1 Tax=Punica granatum TaxID=22663 RepID=A0A2I0L751_PUNGR|nr:hypothetical protein CRG98_003086 [Punica granatum]